MTIAFQRMIIFILLFPLFSCYSTYHVVVPAEYISHRAVFLRITSFCLQSDSYVIRTNVWKVRILYLRYNPTGMIWSYLKQSFILNFQSYSFKQPYINQIDGTLTIDKLIKSFLEMKIWIYLSESNSRNYFYITVTCNYLLLFLFLLHTHRAVVVVILW